MSYQPVVRLPMLLPFPSGGGDRQTSAPVAALAWNAMSTRPLEPCAALKCWSSAEAKLCEITWATWLPTTY